MEAITCMIENGNIYKLEFGNKNCIGVTAEVFSNLKTSAEKAISRNEELAEEKEKYYNMLVENGIIKKPKTADEKMQELEKSQEKILTLLESLAEGIKTTNERLEVLENEFKEPDESC